MSNYLIIGASSGIGKALADNLVNEGHYVFGTFNKTTSVASHRLLDMQALDVLDGEIELINIPEVLDGIIYCPGSINLKPFARIKPESYKEDFDLQVIGAIKVIQKYLSHLKKSENAAIVLFSTVAVQQGFNFHTQVSVSKGAIEGLVKSLSAELAPQVRVNGIAPSLTNTPLASKLLSTEDKIKANGDRHPLKRIGEAEDIANMAAFLLSDKASWITGQIYHVDGGMSQIKA